MLSKIFRADKPRVYLDKIVVVSRDEFDRVDEWGLFKSESLEEGVRQRLEEVFSLPHIFSCSEPKSSDLALEVVVLNVQGGVFDGVSFGEFGGLPLLWRPKVEIVARLYYANSGKTHSSYKAKEKMSWRKYFSGVFSLRGLLRYKPIFGINDIEPILYKACEKLLFSMAKSI